MRIVYAMGPHRRLRGPALRRTSKKVIGDMKISIASLPLMAIVALHAGMAGAQPTAGTAPAPIGASATASGERSTITFSVVGRYDSNVARVDDPALAAARGLEQEDFRISPNVQLDVARMLGRHQIGLRSYLGYDFYTRNSRLDRERIVVEPFAQLDLPVCDLGLSATASRRQSEIGDIILLTPDPSLTIDNTETTRRAAARVTCGDTYGLRPSLEVELASGQNSNPLSRRANYEVTRIQPGVGYASPTLGEISLYAVKQDTDLPNQLTLDGREAGFTLRGAGVGYARNIGTRLKFNGAVSYVEVTPYDGTLGTRSGVNGNIALTLLASERLQFTAFANRVFTSTLTSNATYELQQGYGLSASYAANDRLRLRVGGQYAPRRLFYSLPPTGAFIERQTQTDIFGGATYQLNRRLGLTFDAGYQRRDADLNLFDFDGYYAAVGVTFTL